MPGGLFFPPREVRISASQEHTVEYYRALAAIFPLGIMTVLVLICFICAGCFGKQKPKVKERQSTKAPRPRPDPSKPFSAKEALARERVLRTPTGSPETPPSFDYMNMSFGYGNKSMVGEVRADIEGTYKDPRESPAQTTTPPFARLRPTPPGLFKKEEDQPANLLDQPDEYRSPSPKTLIHQSNKRRFGTWIRTPSTSSSETSDTSQSSMFQMSISDDEAKRAKEEEKKEKDRKRLLKEKKRLKKEMLEDQAEIIWQQINWTVKDESDQKMRESRAIDIPPRKRIEEHPQFQRMVMAMVDQNNAVFDETTVLNSAWERGRIEEFHRRNPGYGPDQMGIVGGEPAEDFSTFLYVKEEAKDLIEEPEVHVDDTQPLLPKSRRKLPKTGAKGKAAEDLSQYYVKKVVPVSEASGEASQHGARKKVPRETGAKSKTAQDVSQYYVKKVVPVTEAEGEASQHGARRKVPRETGAKSKAAQDVSQYYVKKVVPVTEEKGEASQHDARKKVPLETGAKSKAAQDVSQYYVKKVVPVTEAEGEASQQHGVRWKIPLETSLPQFQHGAKQKPCLKTSAKGKAAAVADDSQPLLLQHGVGKKILSETKAKSDAFQLPIHLPVRRVSKGVSSQPLLHHHGAGRKVHESQGEGEKKRKESVDNSQPLFHHYGARKNYGTMLPEVHPIGAFTKKMMDTRVPLVIGKEFEEKSISETRKVSTKIAKAVFDIEMKRIEDQMIASHLNTTERDSEQHVVEINQEPSSGLIRRKPIPVVEIHQNPSSSGLIKKPLPVAEEGKHVVEIHQEPSPSGLIRRKPSPVVDEGEHVVEIHQEPSSSGLIRRKPSPVVDEGEHVVEIHQEPSSSGLIRRKPSPVVDEGEHVVEIHQEPSSSGLIRRKPSPVVDEGEHVVEIHQEPSSSSELIRRKLSPVVEEDTVVNLGDEDTSSSWEDIAHQQKYVWWPGIGDRKKKGAKKKKYGKK